MQQVTAFRRRLIDRAFDEVLALAEAAIVEAGAEIIAKIDHTAAAAGAGMRLRPTTLLIFGNPAGGTKLMQAQPESAIDLPMKLLIVSDDDGGVWILAEDPEWIVARHDGANGLESVVAGMRSLTERVLDMTAPASSAHAR